MDRDSVLEVCRGQRGVTEEFPFSDTAGVFKVAGKMFAIVDIGDGPGSVSLKCDPGYAVVQRETYPAVTAGYHLDKRHWNTIALDGSISGDVLREWIVDSYDLVVAGLTRAARASLG